MTKKRKQKHVHILRKNGKIKQVQVESPADSLTGALCHVRSRDGKGWTLLGEVSEITVTETVYEAKD